MAVEVTCAVWDNYVGSSTNTLVLLALADRADAQMWECYPSVGDTARRTNLSRRAVHTALNCLEAEGVIVRKRYGGITGKSGGKPTTRYRIVKSALLPDSAGAAPWDSAGAALSGSPIGSQQHSNTQIRRSDSAAAAHEPRYEPSKNPRAGVGVQTPPPRDESKVDCPRCNGFRWEVTDAGEATPCRDCGGTGTLSQAQQRIGVSGR